MKEFTIRLCLALSISIGIALAMAMCLSCGASTAQNTAIAATYQAEQLACVDKFKPDNDKVTECRNQVKAKYGRYDGGASDGSP